MPAVVRDLGVALRARALAASLLLAGAAVSCKRDRPGVPNPGHPTVGDELQLRVGTLVFESDCRPDLELSGFTWTESAKPASQPWHAQEPRVLLGADGKLRALAPGPFAATARKKHETVATGGVVLPRGWTAKLVPADATIAVGQHLLRGPGLVSSDRSVTFTAVAPGRTSVTGYLGRHAVRTNVTVVDRAR
jgi:hypothetical protein